MSQQRSQILSGVGVGFELIKALVQAVQNAGGSDDDLRRILSDGDLSKRLAEVIVGIQTFKVIVDYDLTLEQMILVGKYDWVNSGITQSNFPFAPSVGGGKQEKKIVLLGMNYMTSTIEAILEMEKRGLMPAKIEDLLALGAQFPEIQKQFRVICLGSLRRYPGGTGCCPYLDWSCNQHLDWSCNQHLDWSCNQRMVNLRTVANSWGSDCRFACLRK